jgi:hypothetical protein
MMNPKTKKDPREACTAFELRASESATSDGRIIYQGVQGYTTANDLNFIYYKQHHTAVQMQRLHEESYRVVAVEGIQDIQHIFHFES